MFTFLIAIEVIISIVLMLVILMQSSKGGGLAGTFGGGSVGVVFGVRRTADFLVRATQILAGAFLVLALVINLFFLPRATTAGNSVLQQGTQQQRQMTPQLPPPAQPSQPQQAPIQ